MKITFFFLLLFTAFAWADPTNPSFEQMLSLEGTWEGTYAGDTIRLTYEPISGGTALMEKMTWVADGSSMTTIYHRNGDGLMATHYCKKNQPRLVSVPQNATGNFEFKFLDGAKTGEQYLSHLHLKLTNPNQLEQRVQFAGMEKDITVVYHRK